MPLSVTGPVGRVVQRLAQRPRFSLVALRVAPRLDRMAHRLSGGRFVVSQLLIPTLVLTTTGAKSGLPRESPLATLVDGDAFYVVGSNFGTEKHPAWTGNLMKEPAATISFRGRKTPVRAHLLTDEEKAAIWPRLLTVWPTFDSYAERSGRNIRVFRLEPQA
ncbi:MAG TPA: nitroreductase/quinone reductase family protein [Mycobacteriales bacterium]|nr:nitroreductase/quinone reductase family protein [Mycobacteriales bacterium]